MLTPAQYLYNITELMAQVQDGPAASADEAKERLTRVQDVHQKLIELDHSLLLDMQAIRAQYQRRLAAASGTSGGGRVLMSNKNRPGSRARDEEAHRIETERDGKLAPYEEARAKLQELLIQVDNQREHLEKQIQISSEK